MFYTRLPVPQWVGYEERFQQQSIRYLPLIGWLVGGWGGLVYWFAYLIWPQPIAILLSMMATVLLTGALHEDGLADACDGFGGGWSKSQILDIMKDSRLGLFGTVGIGFVLALKFFTLIHLPPHIIPWSLVGGHSISRFMALTLMSTHDYVRYDETSKAKDMTQKLSSLNFGVASFFGILPVVILIPWGWTLIFPLYLVKVCLGRYFQHRLGGYTGDCLGATQQVIEVSFYLLLSLFK